MQGVKLKLQAIISNGLISPVLVGVFHLCKRNCKILY